MNKRQVIQDVERTLGTVPEWIRSFPDDVAESLWNLVKAEMNPDTRIPPKYKELIGLAVAATIHCKYCTYFHTEAARAAGASEDEIKETLLEAGTTNLFSTYLNGSQYDFELFKKEFGEMMEKMRQEELVAASE